MNQARMPDQFAAAPASQCAAACGAFPTTKRERWTKSDRTAWL
ncbi:MAG: hypothetical protein DKINENOH_01620 [bacterium]|nr:hypothetical protein [bacterium]